MVQSTEKMWAEKLIFWKCQTLRLRFYSTVERKCHSRGMRSHKCVARMFLFWSHFSAQRQAIRRISAFIRSSENFIHSMEIHRECVEYLERLSSMRCRVALVSQFETMMRWNVNAFDQSSSFSGIKWDDNASTVLPYLLFNRILCIPIDFNSVSIVSFPFSNRKFMPFSHLQCEAYYFCHL